MSQASNSGRKYRTHDDDEDDLSSDSSDNQTQPEVYQFNDPVDKETCIVVDWTKGKPERYDEDFFNDFVRQEKEATSSKSKLDETTKNEKQLKCPNNTQATVGFHPSFLGNEIDPTSSKAKVSRKDRRKNKKFKDPCTKEDWAESVLKGNILADPTNIVGARCGYTTLTTNYDGIPPFGLLTEPPLAQLEPTRGKTSSSKYLQSLEDEIMKRCDKK